MEYENPETAYQVIIDDRADLLDGNNGGVRDLSSQMELISAYGNAMLLTVNENSSSADKLAQTTYYNTFGNENGCIFLIDMDNREIIIASDGKSFKKTINRSAILTITDNVYQYAASGDYTACALNAFYQIATQLEGGRIAAPMRYLSAFFLAILVALILTFIMAKMESSTSLTDEKELLKSLSIEQKLHHARRSLIKREIVKESSGGGGGSVGGGGGGGGGFSGSSGGHGF